MKLNKWTKALAATGLVGAISAVQAEESSVKTALSSTTISGYVETSAIWQPGDGNLTAGRSFDGADKMDGFNFHVANIVLQSPLDEGNWAAGYTVDLLFGPDANLYGTTSSIAGSANSDFAIKQATVDLRVPVGNGIDVRMGTFDTVVGYEVFASGSNPNFGRSYGYFIEPFAHTGVLGSYQFNDYIGLSLGIADSYFNAVNARPQAINFADGSESEKTFLGLLTLNAPDSWGFLSGSSLAIGGVNGNGNGGPNGGAGGNDEDSSNWYASLTVPMPVDGLAAGIAYDYSDNTFGFDSHAWALATYISYQATEKLALHGRIDYTEASNGIYYFDASAGADKNELFSLTLTADYALWENVISRAEIRWDSADEDAFGDAGAPAGGDTDDLVSVALNLIYLF
ncbi:MAG TPA: hypothetical protein EYQ50_13940 [Verrucomicrobiales bacterium]|nr:hypothetical protein [Verrucomicrobiales bacterium]HIL68821.1 hypothetical protein [Verrucomicrobiota bacterium]